MKVDHGFSDGKPWLSYCAILAEEFHQTCSDHFPGPNRCSYFLLFFEVLISDLGIKSFDAFQICGSARPNVSQQGFKPLGGQRMFSVGIFLTRREMT